MPKHSDGPAGSSTGRLFRPETVRSMKRIREDLARRKRDSAEIEELSQFLRRRPDFKGTFQEAQEEMSRERREQEPQRAALDQAKKQP
jgi:hypothetical protein